MSNNFKFRGLQILIKPGVTLIADVENLEDVKEVLTLLKEQGLLTEQVPPNLQTNHQTQLSDDPHILIEFKANLPQGSLIGKKILAFKDGVPQLLQNGIFTKVTDAILVLVYAVEVGLRTSKIPYDQFKSLFEAQTIKSGSSLSLLLNNLKGSGYIDKKLYDTDRTISLTAKGVQKASDVLKTITGKI